MNYKIRDSQAIGYLNRSEIDLDSIRDKIVSSKTIDENMRNKIISNIETIVGQQEVEWINNNTRDRLVEYIVYRYKFKNYPKMKILEQFPLHLLVEPTSVCNLRCVMCFQNDRSFRNKRYWGFMDLSLFKLLVDQAVENNCKALTLASRGEPTLHRDFGKMLEYCKGKFLELKINTNALTLDEALCYKILDSGVDIVVFSVDSHTKSEYEKIRLGSDFDRVLSNIKMFCRIKKSNDKYRKTSTRVSGIDLNNGQDKEKFYAFWKDIVGIVVLTEFALRWDTYNNEFLSCNMPCNLLWERMYVWFNGICNPCDFDYKSTLSVGDARNSSLKEVWLGEKYNTYRALLLEGKRNTINPCNKCNLT
ncbi:MAG: radical SAM protein [Candidatus Saganbacteria bacterium]|nr:radical SAM protein [Candidatus Saganbacteria bacterium]